MAREPGHLRHKNKFQPPVASPAAEEVQRYAGLQVLPLRPILGMDDPWGYRNKAQLHMGREANAVISGLYWPGSHRWVDISGCPVQDPVINRVIGRVNAILSELGIPIYDERTLEGGGPHVVVRVAKALGRVQLTLITAADCLPDSRRLVQRIRKTFPWRRILITIDF